MSNFASAFGKKFEQNKDLVRIRSFEFGTHTFKVKVPLTVEYEAMMERVKKADEAQVKKYYDQLAKQFLDNKANFEKEEGVEFKEDDIVVQGRSLMETARNKVITENRITAMIQMLVPEEKGFDMSTISYEMIDEIFPFSIQMELIEKIADVISPNYSASKGK